jgi:drug/metabolite transporter (DMT)-like permease
LAQHLGRADDAGAPEGREEAEEEPDAEAVAVPEGRAEVDGEGGEDGRGEARDGGGRRRGERAASAAPAPATAAAAAWLMHQRARLGFWVFAAVGSALVAVYSVLRASQMGHGFGLTWADTLLVGAVVAASLGYVAGAKVTASMGAEKVISWVCVMALPLTLPGAWLTWPDQTIAPISWLALLYVGVFSMWAGFFAWFRGLSLGGPLRVSQLQLLQPFISILAAVPLLGESLDAMTLGFALLVVGTVFMGRRMANTPKAN